MTEDWNEISLKELVTVRPGKYVPKSEYVDDGPFWIYGSNSVMGRYDQALVHEPHIVMAAVGAYASAVRFSSQPSWVNNNAFALIPNERVEPFWLYLWLDSALSREAVLAGTGQPYVKRPALLDQKLRVPPLAVQRRIVDLLAHLDNHLANLQTERDTAIGLLERLALDQLNLPGENGIELQGLLVRNIGGVWGDDPGAGELTVDVFRSTEFSDLGYLDCAAEAQRSISSRQYESRFLSSGDILVEKSGGTPTRSVGRVVRVDTDDLSGPAIGANFLQLLRADATLVEPDYLFWVLWASHRRGDGFAYQQASTNIRNLKTKEYLSRRITLPDAQEQRAIAALLDACLMNVKSLEREIQALAATRSSLLGALLGGSRAMPASYDSFLSEVG